MEILRFKNLSFTYPDGVPAVDDVSFSVGRGEFVVLCGESGCGKTTLLRLAKKELAPFGSFSGQILYDDIPVNSLPDIRSASEIGFVTQNPESQIVTDKVWHELAFGLENIGVAGNEIRRRVGEMAGFFGIESWFSKDVSELSGGQKQLLNLASVMVINPQLILLDEPTSQLDPIAAGEFISTLFRLNRELGLTVVIAEHRLEEVLPLADRVAVLSRGRLVCCDAPERVYERIKSEDCGKILLPGFPAAVRIFTGTNGVGKSPLTVREGKAYLSKNFKAGERLDSPAEKSVNKKPVLELKDIWHRYDKESEDVLRGVDLAVGEGEIYCLLGGNGVGKTTALGVAAGMLKPYRGKIFLHGKKVGGGGISEIAMLPQNPGLVFTRDCVREDMMSLLDGAADETAVAMVEAAAARHGAEHLLGRHPCDLSGGELQKCALAKIMLREPKILLLDEPTKGLDPQSKARLSADLKKISKAGISIFIVTHDADFAAETAQRCGLLFNGQIISEDEPAAFFSANTFYTTAASRISRHIYPGAVTCGEVIKRCLSSGEAFPEAVTQ